MGSAGEGRIIFGRKLTGQSGDPDHRQAALSVFNTVSLSYNYVKRMLTKLMIYVLLHLGSLKNKRVH
jgi:hypothetical protein